MPVLNAMQSNPALVRELRVGLVRKFWFSAVLLSMCAVCGASDTESTLTVQVSNEQDENRPRRNIIVQSFLDETCTKPKKLKIAAMDRDSGSTTLKPLKVRTAAVTILDFTLHEYQVGLYRYCGVMGAATLKPGTAYVAHFMIDGNMAACSLELHEQEGGHAVEFVPFADTCTIKGNKSGIGTAVRPEIHIRVQP